MPYKRLRVLIVDDSADDALLVTDAITGPEIEIISERVDDAPSLRAALERGPWDVVISDYSMPNFTAEEALGIVSSADPNLPFLVVSGIIGEDAAVAMMRAGALDYVMKDALGRLLPAIRREMREVKTRKARDAAEAVMNELRQRLLTTVERAPVGIVNVAANGRFLHVNQRFCDMVGYECAELLALSFADITHPLDVGRDTENMRRMALGEIPEYRTEKRYVRKDGQTVYASLSSAAIYGPDAEFLYFASIMLDITEKKQMERTGLLQKRELEEAQRIAHLGSWSRNLPGNAIAWSEGMFKIYGVDETTTPTIELVLSLIMPEDREEFAASIGLSIERGLPVDVQYRIVRPDGIVRTVHTVGEVSLDEAGVPVHIRGVTQDITERLQAAAEHETLNRDVQLLLESTTQGIFGVDRGGYCTFMNRAASEALGYSAGELVGLSMHAVVHQGPDCSHAAADCPIEAAARTGTSLEAQADRLCRRDGIMLPVEYSGAPMIDGGAVKGAVVVFTDISERKLLQAQLEQSDRVSSLGRLAATMAHEFNNVLMGIQPFAEVLSRQNSADSIQRVAHNILQAVQRGRSITSGILRFARPAEMVQETIDVSTWLRSMDAGLTAVVGDRIRFRLRIDGEGLFIRGDRHQLEQVLTNLATNARDAMGGSGELSVAVERCLSGYVVPFGAIRTADPHLHISVTDTGCGMDAKTLKAIFDPFFTTKRSGTGLGLAVVHQVMHQHGGSVVAESTPGKGTVFHLFLPCSEGAFVDVGSRPLQDVQRASVGSVLMVEDDEAIADGVAVLLREEGIVVEVAASGAAALASLARHVPEAVILDIGLPDIDGRLLYARIAASYPSLPVVFASGSNDGDMLRPYLRPGRIASLTKPYEFDTLLEVLDSLKPTASPVAASHS